MHFQHLGLFLRRTAADLSEGCCCCTPHVAVANCCAEDLMMMQNSCDDEWLMMTKRGGAPPARRGGGQVVIRWASRSDASDSTRCVGIPGLMKLPRITGAS